MLGGGWARPSAGSRNGATPGPAAASPTHQVVNVSRTPPGGTAPPARLLATPMPAESRVLAPAAPTISATTPRSVSQRPPPKRRTIHAPASASLVLPAAIPAAIRQSVGPAALAAGLVALAAKAPSATPGHRRAPPSASAASESPVGGQTGVATPLTGSSASPARAVSQYTAARPATRAQSPGDRGSTRRA